MKPSLLQYIFANHWLEKVYLGIAVTLGATLAVRMCQPSLAMFSDWQYLILFIVFVVLIGTHRSAESF